MRSRLRGSKNVFQDGYSPLHNMELPNTTRSGLPVRARLIFLAAVIILVLVSTAEAHRAFSDSSKSGYAGTPTLYTVVLGKDSFSPDPLSIYQGDTVRFVSSEPEAFWPASDPHPTHSLYPAFDPLEPVPGDQSWSFTFTKVGIWHYHNHLEPSLRGTIIVLDPNSTTTPKSTCTYAQAAAGDETCFEQMVRTAIDQGGIDAGWQVFTSLYDTGKAPASCHWTAHLIGQEAYQLFKEGKTVPLSAATTYCGYGFYHGFMSALLHDNPNPSLAISFCSQVEAQLGKAAQNNCFHGIGHGFTPETVLPAQLGDIQALLKTPLTICSGLFRNMPLTESICDSGAFDVLGEYMSQNQFGFSINTKDPLGICSTLDPKYFVTCYTEMAPKFDFITNWDVSKIPLYMTEVSNEYQRQDIVRIAAGTMMQRDVSLNTWNNYISGCHALPGDLQDACFSGIVWGMTIHGEPQKESVQPLKFCASTMLSDTERSACYGNLSHWLGLLYKPDRLQQVCALVPEQYRTVCVTNISPQNQ